MVKTSIMLTGVFALSLTLSASAYAGDDEPFSQERKHAAAKREGGRARMHHPFRPRVLDFSHEPTPMTPLRGPAATPPQR